VMYGKFGRMRNLKIILLLLVVVSFLYKGCWVFPGGKVAGAWC